MNNSLRQSRQKRSQFQKNSYIPASDSEHIQIIPTASSTTAQDSASSQLQDAYGMKGIGITKTMELDYIQHIGPYVCESENLELRNLNVNERSDIDTESISHDQDEIPWRTYFRTSM